MKNFIKFIGLTDLLISALKKPCRPMIKFVVAAVIVKIFFMFFPISHPIFAKDSNHDESLPIATAVTPETNLHFTGKFCAVCHEKTPVKGGRNFLKYGGDFKQLCRCHNSSSESYIHPVDIKPSVDKMTRMPPDFPLQHGKMACITCHDIFAQCQKSSMNKVTLRGAPYQRRTDFCFKCHDKRNYMMLNAHDQLNEKREIIVERCLFCHVEKPNEKSAAVENLKFIGGLEMLCQRCHLIRGNHSGNFNHMVKPSPKGLAIMKKIEKKFGIILPLDADGKMTCITCHNPHERGVISPGRAAARGADSKFRHRLPGKMCVECHMM